MKRLSAVAVALAAFALSPVPGAACDPPGQDSPPFTAFPLRRADALKTAARLSALLGCKRGSVTADATTNTIYIRACPEDLERAKRLLNRLDVGWSDHVKIIHLQRIDAARTAKPLQLILTLGAFLRGDESGFRLIVDEKNNAIMILGSEETMQQASQILQWLDLGPMH
jgi:type II secretory pathway component GspD/PulD (secretin)